MPSLAATAEPNLARMLLVLTWPEVSQARVVRLDPDGREQPVRGGDPVRLAGSAVLRDHEAPLDEPVRYQATSGEASGVLVESSATVLPSHGQTWLKHPGTPVLNQPLPVVEGLDDEENPADLGIFDVPGRATPIVITAPRKAARTSLRLATLSSDQSAALAALLTDGAVLLLQTPAGYGWGSHYVAIGDVRAARVAPGIGGEPARRWLLPLTVVDRPGGLAAGTPGSTWADAAAAYPTWAALKVGEPTWLDLTVRAGP